jgi:hypothetical protein
MLLEPVSSNPLVGLEELDIRLVATALSLPRYRKKIYESLLAFINSHRDTLQVLRISSFEDMDLTSTFIRLSHFPSLKKLCISFKLNQRTLSDPSSLIRFLNTHQNTLEHFCI